MDEVKLLPCAAWRPMSQVPKHGERIYVLQRGGRAMIAYANPELERGLFLGWWPLPQTGIIEAIAAWNTRPTLVTDEVVEQAIEAGEELLAYLEAMQQPSIVCGGREFLTDDLRTLLSASRAAMPTIDQDGGE